MSNLIFGVGLKNKLRYADIIRECHEGRGYMEMDN